MKISHLLRRGPIQTSARHVLLSIGLISGLAQGQEARIEAYGPSFTQPEPAPHAQARIYAYRASESISPAPINLYLNGRYVASLLRGGYTQFCLQPGRPLMQSALDDAGQLHLGKTLTGQALDTQNGRVLYLRVTEGAGRQTLVQPLSESQALPEIRQTRLQQHTVPRAPEVQTCNAELAKRRKRTTIDDVLRTLEKGEVAELKIIIKGDVSGSVEALEDALLAIDIGDENVSLRVIHRGVGAITENDVTLASASDALIIGFNVRPEGKSRDLAEREGVEVRFYNVIYSVIDDIESSLKGMRKAEYEEHGLGTAEVREVFRSSKFGNIAGCMVQSGEIKRKAKARLIRDGAVVKEDLSIDTLRRFKDDATEVREGFECGIGLGSFNDVKVGDIIETFEMREKVLA